MAATLYSVSYKTYAMRKLFSSLCVDKKKSFKEFLNEPK